MTTDVQIQPQNIEAEESVLGAMLVSASAVSRVLDEVGLAPEDFFHERNAGVFQCIRTLTAAGDPVDEISVRAGLTAGQRESIENSGGRPEDYIAELAAKVPAAGNAAHYAEIVQRASGDRRRIEITRRLADPNLNGDGPLLLEELAELIHARQGGAQVRTADLARVRPIRWGWTGRLLLGYLNLLLGAEGIGKGTLTAWIMARLTCGKLPGDLLGEPSRILILGDEDAFDSVWVPRLYAAGADLDYIDTIDDEFSLATGADPLRRLVEKHDYRVVYFDALLDNLGSDVDDWRSKEVRDRLRPARQVARELDVLMLGALHPNKGQRASFRDLVSGSHAFNASSRSSLMLAAHPDDDDRRVLVRGKGNLSSPPPSFEFSIQGRDLEINGHGFSLPVLADEHDGDLSIEDVVKPQREAPVRESLAEEIDSLGKGEIQTRAEIARALGRSNDDRSIGRALDQLEDQGRWEKVDRGKWRAVGIGTYRNVPMSKTPEEGEA